MKVKCPNVRLGEVLKRSEEIIWLAPDVEYSEITVRLWGKGVMERRRVPGAGISGDRRFAARSAQFIVSRIDARNGAMGLVPPELDGAIVTNDFPLFDLDKTKIQPEFLGWLCQTREFVELCQRASEGTTNRVRLQEGRFLALEIRFPPLEEQRRIVARIEELATQINEARTLRQQATVGAGALIASATTAACGYHVRWGKVRDAVLKRKGAVRNGPFGSQLLHEEFVESGVAAIGTRDVQINRFQLGSGWFVTREKFEGLRRYQVFPGDVLCTIVGGSIGRFCVVPSDIPLAFTTKHVQTLTLDTNTVEPRFASYMLNFHRRCQRSLFSQVEGSAQPSLNAEKILATELPLPHLSEQHRIVAELDALQTRLDELKRLQIKTSAELDLLLPSILDGAFKGDL